MAIIDGDLDLLDVFKSNGKKNGSTIVTFGKITVSNARVNLNIENDFALLIQKLAFQTAPFDSQLSSLQFDQFQATVSSDNISLSATLLGKLRLLLNSKASESKVWFDGVTEELSAFDIATPKQSRLNTVLTFNKKRLQLQNFSIAHPKMNLEASGSYDIVNDNLDMQLSANFANSKEVVPLL